jgi:hypothetical protein
MFQVILLDQAGAAPPNNLKYFLHHKQRAGDRMKKSYVQLKTIESPHDCG